MGYVVKAPYVTLKVRDERGAVTLLGFYAGAAVPDGVEKESLDKHLDSGMVVDAKSVEADAVAPAGGPVDFDEAGSPIAPEAAPQPPARSASKADWEAFAVSQGVPESEAKAASRDDLAKRFPA